MADAPGPEVNPIATCGACRAVLVPGATFCDRCGAPRGAGPVVREPRRPAPDWLRRDWPLATAVAALVAVAFTAVCVAYGIALAALSAGSDAIVPGALVGALLPFAAMGGEVTGYSGTQSAQVVLLLDHTPLVLTAVAGLLTWLALRPGVTRLAEVPSRARAMVAKVAVLLALVVLVAGGFTDTGGPATFTGGDERRTLASTAGGTAALGTWLLVGAVGAVLLVRRRVSICASLPLDLRRALLAARAGAAAFVVVLLVSGIGGLLVLGAAADSTRDKLAVAASAPLTLSAFGTVGSAVAHGGAAGSTDVQEGLAGSVERLDLPGQGGALRLDDLDPDDVQRCAEESGSVREERQCLRELYGELLSGAGADGAYRDALRLSQVEPGPAHVSLADWELPLTDDSGRAPWWAFLSLLVPLGALAGATLLLLRRANPPTEGWALRLGLGLGFGYAFTCALVAGLSPGAVVATGTSLQSDDFGVLLVPALGSSLGLPLLWGALVPFATGLLWSRRRGLPGNVFVGLGAVPVRTPVACRSCGTLGEATDAFCATCGRPLRADVVD